MALPQRVVYLDLNTKKVETKEISEEVTKEYLGGRGINMHLLSNHLTPGTDALSPANPLIIGPGLLTGLRGVGATRCSISGKSPETGFLGDANIGGNFGAYLKQAGIDYLFITGAAEKPSYIHLDGERVHIEDARDLWGQTTDETNTALNKRHGDSSASISIGTAGENLVRFACIINRRKNAAGRTGMGCLMGSKKIKAISVTGKNPIEPKNKGEFNELKEKFQQGLDKEPLVKLLREYGSSLLFILINRRIGMGRAYNGQTNRFPENSQLSPQRLRDRFFTGRNGCFGCPVACQHIYKTDNIENDGPEYSILGSFGPVLGVKNLPAVLEMNHLVNRYGLDGSSTANLIAWAIELFTRKRIDLKTTGGLRLDWGDEAVIIELIHRIARRQGFGNLLAGGAREAVAELGKDTARYMLWTKYLPQSDPVDLRHFPAYALGNSVASRGSDHLRGRPTWEAYGIKEETLAEIYGGRVANDPRSYEGKGRVIWWWETYLAVIDALGLCKLIAHHCQPGLINFQFLAELIDCATGLHLTPEEVFTAGERIVNLERLILVREGVRREHDFPPQRYFEPLAYQEDLKPEEKDRALDKASFERMLDEYYQLRGWDREGKPQAETLQRLGLNECIPALSAPVL